MIIKMHIDKFKCQRPDAATSKRFAWFWVDIPSQNRCHSIHFFSQGLFDNVFIQFTTDQFQLWSVLAETTQTIVNLLNQNRYTGIVVDVLSVLGSKKFLVNFYANIKKNFTVIPAKMNFFRCFVTMVLPSYSLIKSVSASCQIKKPTRLLFWHSSQSVRMKK